MAVVSAFGILNGTQRAGMTAYYIADGCDSVTISDVLPILSKIDYYEDEYVIGEMLIWDSGVQSIEPNNCAMVKVIIYNDGWICAWFEHTYQNQLAMGAAQYVSSIELTGWGSSLGYEHRWNGAILEITSSTDPDCPVGTRFGIRYTDYNEGSITVYYNKSTAAYHFNSGYAYGVDIYMTNGNLVWWGHAAGNNYAPPHLSNRLYRAIYQIWEAVGPSSNSTNWAVSNASYVYMYDSQTDVYTDETTDFNDDGINDCQVFPTDEVIGDAFYIGLSEKFSGVSITMGTPGAGSAVTWEYCNGSVWLPLTLVDGTSGFTSTGEVTFNPPDDWLPMVVYTQSYYWIRARVTTASYTVTPLLTQGQLYKQDSASYLDTAFGLYSFEDTSANYCMISGIHGYSGIGSTDRYFYNTVLPGKTIYHYDANFGMYYDDTHYSSLIGCSFNVNGNTLYYESYRYSDFKSNGYAIEDITSIDYAPGIQNAINIWGQSSGTSGGARYTNMATVLITS